MNHRMHTATIPLAALIMALTCSAVAAQNRHGGQGGGGHRGGNLSHGQHHGGHGGQGGYVGHGGHGRYGGYGGRWGGGPFWGGIGLGVGLGLGTYYFTRPWYPDQIVIQQPPVVYYDTPPVLQAPLVSAVPQSPDPIFYPRTGQSPALTESDRQACNRWATSQPSAMAEASVFQRAVLACMDGRGYTSR